MCEKVSFRGRAAAQRAARKLTRTGDFWRVYACPICGGWHLTTQRDDPRVSLSKLVVLKQKSAPRASTLEELEELARALRARASSGGPAESRKGKRRGEDSDEG